MSKVENINNLISLDNVRAVILIGPLDFGRCPLASNLSCAMWPMLDKPAVRNVINQIAAQGIKKITICSKEHTKDLQKCLDDIKAVSINIITDELPAGTAGSLRNAVPANSNDILIVLSASLAIVPNINYLLECHKQANAELTVAFNPSENDDQFGDCAEIYICQPSVPSYIPAQGYCDIKETLVPELVKAGKTVHPAVLQQRPGGFRNIPAYLKAIEIYIASPAMQQNYPQLELNSTDNSQVWTGSNCQIDETVKFFGPAVVMDNAVIESHTTIIGPALIGADTWIGKDCLISNAALWQGAGLGHRSKIQNSAISYNTKLLCDSQIENQPIVPKSTTEITPNSCSRKTNSVFSIFAKSFPANITPDFIGNMFSVSLAAVFILAAIIWSYSTTIVELKSIWLRSDEYSSGMLVPFLAVYVLWIQRRKLAEYSIRPAILGLFALVGIQAIRLLGLYFNYGSIERASFILTIAATVLLCLGWKLFFKLLPILAFLLLMLPLPNRFNQTFSFQLQEWATGSAVWVLEMLGYIINRQGNIIHIADTSVAVAEACNGLRMITAFFVIAGWFALLVNRKWWEKIIIVISALPISLLCNTIRLAITSIAFTKAGLRQYASLFHDFGGYAMMPIAIAMIVLELWILRNIFVQPKAEIVKEQIITRKRNSQVKITRPQDESSTKNSKLKTQN